MGSRRILRGIPAVQGASEGNIRLLPTFQTVVPHHHIPDSKIDEEVRRFQNALSNCRGQIADLLDQNHIPAEHRGIFEAQILIYEDPMVVEETIARIQNNKINTEWALSGVIDTIKNALGKSGDPLFRGRIADIEDAGNRVFASLLGLADSDVRVPFIKKLTEKDILVAEEISPSLFLFIHKPIAGIATERGGITDHTAILARDRGIPAVIGVKGLCESILDNAPAILNGNEGVLIVNPDDRDRAAFADFMTRNRPVQIRSPIRLPEGDEIRIWVNLDAPEQTERADIREIHGVGLFRTEFIYLNDPALLDSIDRQTEIYSRIMTGMNGKPVTFRLIDIGDDKNFFAPILAHTGSGSEYRIHRGIEFLLHNPLVLISQMKSIFLAAAELGHPPENCRILVPMITTVEQIREIRRQMNAVLLEVCGKIGREMAFPIGIMIETPSACLMSDALSEECDFFSFGTNDLARYTLAINRMDNELGASLYYQPSVIRMMREAINRSGHPLSICGEMAGFPDLIPVLIGLGVRDLSISVAALGTTAATLENLTLTEAREKTERVLLARSVEEVKGILQM
jgi:phosphotransferase system enzyme I (PtsI)